MSGTKKNPKENKLIVYAEPLNPKSYILNPEVSYRLTASRFDWLKWPNTSSDNVDGFVIEEK